jgi:hypothetical protein
MHFLIFLSLYDSCGKCLSIAKNQTSLPCLCPKTFSLKHLYFFKKGNTLGAQLGSISNSRMPASSAGGGGGSSSGWDGGDGGGGRSGGGSGSGRAAVVVAVVVEVAVITVGHDIRMSLVLASEVDRK